MKRVGYILLISVALLAAFTLGLAQLEVKTAKHLLRVLSGESVRGYFGSAAEGTYAWTSGKPLFAVSATGELNGPTRVGKIFLYDDLLAETPAMTISGVDDGDLFGKTLSGGDWNGDGKPDLAVGAPNYYGAGTREKSPAGKVYIYLGGEDFGKTPPKSMTAGELQDGFGDAINMKSDLNGDGLADLVIGAPHSAKSGATSGRAYVWWGKSEGTPSQNPDVEIKLGTTNDLFGTSVSTGDLNGDGIADLAIGAPHYNVGEKLPGGVFIFWGGKNIDLSKPSQILTGENSGFQDEFGWSVCVIDDQNGDKAKELLVSAPQYSSGGAQFGKVYLYNGGQKLGTEPARSFVGTAEAAKFGASVFSIGDVNKDGKGDFAVQAESESGSKGVVHFYYAGWEKSFYEFTGEATADRAGHAVTALGDLDGNGSYEVLVGARWNDALVENGGRAYILSLE